MRGDRKRIRAASTVLVAMVLVVSACTDDDDSATPPTGPVTTAPVATVAPATTSPPDGAPATTVAPATTQATSPPTTAAPSDEESVLIVATPDSIRSFDPAIGIQFRDLNIYQQIYDTLVLQRADGTIERVLATDWTISDDGLTYTFNLREGVVFSNGEPFEADDVAFSFLRYQEQGVPLVRARWERVASITAIDPLTVEFKLTEYDAGFFANLTNPLLLANSILNREATEAADPSLSPVGTGPFVVESYSPGSDMVLVRNENYWRAGVPVVDRLIVRTIPVQTSQVSALTAGEIDIMFPTAATALTLQGTANITLLGVPSAETIGVQVHAGREPFDDVNVRRAVALAIDRQQVIDLAFFGAGAATAGTVSPAYEWAAGPGELPYTEYDPVEAMRLLTEAGFPDGFDVEIMTLAGHETWAPLIEVVASQLEDVGLNVTIVNEESGVWLDRFVNGDFQMTNHHFVFGPDPFQYLRVRRGRNGPIPDELAALEVAVIAEPDPEARIVLLQQILAFQVDIVYPNVAIVAPNLWIAYRDGLENVNFDFTGRLSFLAEVQVTG